jgi:hypothetical protein
MKGAPRIGFKPCVPSIEVGSARFRCFLPVKYLRAAGWNCELFDPGRWAEYRAVVFQKAYTPEDLELASRLTARGIRTVFDLCDDLFFNADGSREGEERSARLRAMVERVDAVSVSTAGVARAVGRPCQVIDEALDEIQPEGPVAALRTAAATALWRLQRRTLRLVWFGNAGLDMPRYGLIDLARLVPALNDLHHRLPLSLTVVSNSEPAFRRHTAGAVFPLRFHLYHSATYQRLLRRHDACLIPVSPNPLTLCKSFNRPALSLLLGVAVVADYIPSYEELRPYVLIGDWAENLRRYADEPATRRAHIRAGQRYLKRKYTPEHVVQQWGSLLTPLVA